MGKTYNILDAEVAQVVEQRTENPRVSGSTPLLGTNYEGVKGIKASSVNARRSGGMVDAAVSKTVGGQPPCRFESDLRHHGFKNLNGSPQKSKVLWTLLPGCVAVAQRTLDPLAQVRILARQPIKSRKEVKDWTF